jgi:hypothetical protein
VTGSEVDAVIAAPALSIDRPDRRKMAFERRHSLSLPEGYRQFLLAVNGGRLAPNSTRMARQVINSLLSLSDKEQESRDLETCAECGATAASFCDRFERGPAGAIRGFRLRVQAASRNADQLDQVIGIDQILGHALRLDDEMTTK